MYGRTGHLQGNLPLRVCEAARPSAWFSGKFCQKGDTRGKEFLLRVCAQKLVPPGEHLCDCIAQRGCHDSLDGVHPVFRLVKDDALGPLEHLVGDFHGVPAEPFAHLLADDGLVVVEGGQAVHKHGLRPGGLHQGGVDLVGGQVGDPLGPDLHRLAHRDPHVGVEDVRPFGGGERVLLEAEGGPGLGGDGLALGDESRVGPVFFGGAGGEVQPHLGAAHHQAVAHVVAGVPEIDEVDPFQLAEVLPDGQKVGQDLGGVELVGQAVPDRHAGVVGQLLYDLLAVAAVLDAVKHPAQHPGGVGDGFLFADLAARGVQIGHFHAQVVGGHLKAAPGAGGGLFKNEGDVFAPQPVVADAGLFLGLEGGCQVDERADLGGGIVEQLQKAAAFQIHRKLPFLHIYRLTCINNRKYAIIIRRPDKTVKLQGKLDPAPAGVVGRQADARLFQHEACRHAGIAVVVLVVVVNDLPDARLDDGLGALVAGEQGDVDPRPLEVIVGAVEDGVQLGVADVHIFGVQRLALAAPGHGVVVAAHGHPVVAQGQDLVLGADDAGPHLAVGVLRAHGGEQRDAHKVFVPVDVVVALFHKRRLPAQFVVLLLYRISVQNTMQKRHLTKCTKVSCELWKAKFGTNHLKLALIVVLSL